MNKIKIFNKVTRCILVAMLALLPNAMWGDTTIDKVVTINDICSSLKEPQNISMLAFI